MNNNPLDEARESYSSEWEMTSNYFQQNGYYDWCAKNINEHSKVLEIGIGIGIGNSTLSLLTRGCKITGIEENYYNINKTISLLKANKIPFGAIFREKKEVIIQKGKYNVNYLDMDLTTEEIEQVPIIILQGDFIHDDNLKKWILKNEKYDAIVCWFTGVHGIIYEHALHSVKNPTEYRMLLHDFIFQFTPHLLKPNGVINICDRIKQFDDKTEQTLINEMKRIYKFQERNLEFKSSEQIVVDGFDTPDGIQHDRLLTNPVGGKKALYSMSIGFTADE